MVVAVFASMISFQPLVAARVDKLVAAHKAAALSSLAAVLARKTVKVKTNMQRLPWIWPRSIAVMTIASS